jgi:hypothetical protein
MPQLINPRGRIVNVSKDQVEKLVANGWSVPRDKQTTNYNPLYDGVVNKDGPALSDVEASNDDYLEGVIEIW